MDNKSVRVTGGHLLCGVNNCGIQNERMKKFVQERRTYIVDLGHELRESPSAMRKHMAASTGKTNISTLDIL